MSTEDKIASEINRADRAAASIAKESQRRFRENAGPGTVIPEFGEYEAADDVSREAIRRTASDCVDNIESILDSAHASHARDMSAPASADDVATVQLALSRKSISGDELEALMSRYGGNYQLAQSIREKGHEIGHYFDGGEVHDIHSAKAKARHMLTRYNYDARGNRGFSLSAESTASDIMDAYTHTDIFGKRY